MVKQHPVKVEIVGSSPAGAVRTQGERLAYRHHRVMMQTEARQSPAPIHGLVADDDGKGRHTDATMGAPLRVLIVTANEAHQTRLERALLSYAPPFRVSGVACGADCLRELTGGDWDAVVLDSSLPDAGGSNLLERIQTAIVDL